jgi:hypothetical protein
MKRSNLWMAAAAALAVAALALTAKGDDLAPPSYRGQAGSTMQAWDFSTPGQGAPPSVYYPVPDEANANPYGDAQAWVIGSSATYTPPGLWYGFELMRFAVPNRDAPPEGTWKDLRLQVTYGGVAGPPAVTVYHGRDPFVKEGEYVLPLGDFRYLLVQDWAMEPNPLQEFVEIRNSPQSGMTIDQVVIDTRCVPEPATLCLMGAGAAGAVLGRRRKR